MLKLLLNQKNYIFLNKILIKNIGLYETIILGEFIDYYDYYDKNQLLKNDCFFYTYDKIRNELGIKEDTAKKAITHLEQLEIITSKKMGLPAKKYFKINNDVLENLIKELSGEKDQEKAEQEELKKEEQVPEKKQDKTYYKQQDKTYYKQQVKTYQKKQDITNNINTNNINTNNKENIKRKEKDLNLDFIEDEEVKDIINDWLDYKKERNQSYKSQRSLIIMFNRLIKLSGNNLSIMKEIVETSIANNWNGLFPLKDKKIMQQIINDDPVF